MNRDYHHWHSPSLGRKMELLVFGHAGPPLLVFPTSKGRFFDYEDRGKVSFVLATGENDICLNDNVRLAHMLDEKGVPRLLDVWEDGRGREWPWWRRKRAKFVQ